MKCKNCVNLECDWCDMKADSPDPDIERDCHWFAQKTNADHIRAMTDEELAEWFSIYCCRNKTYDAHCETFGSCKACWSSWLQEEAKE